MSIAFVILNWNNFYYTKRAIESLIRSELTLDNSGMIIVVDNGSNFETRKALTDYFQVNGWNILSEDEIPYAGEKNHTLILNNGNYGYARGNNIGLKFAKRLGFRYAVVMNNDVLVTEPVTPTLVTILQEIKDAAVIGPRVVGLDGKEQSPYWRMGIFDYFLLPVFYPVFYPFKVIKKSLFKKYIFNSCQRRGYAEVYNVIGCFMLVDLEKMEKVGWFDEETFLYAEEPILAERLSACGYKTLYTNKVSVFHEHEISTRRLLGDNRWKSALSSDLYYLKRYRHYGPIRLFLVKVGRYVRFKLEEPVIRMVKQMMSNVFKRRDSSCAKVSS